MNKLSRIMVCLLVLCITGSLPAAAEAGVSWGAYQQQSNVPLRVEEPLESVIADLVDFIPAYMAAEDVPGVSIALIREGKIVWTEGFGVADRFTRRPVTPFTTFKVASNSKVITAYIALKLVDLGLLSIEEPLDNYLPEPTMLQAEYRSAVNLRRVLSHTSGLGHGGTSREVRFAPGANYSYSANGFLFAQEVMEEVSGESLENLGDELVFKPLGMEKSSFVSSAAVMAEPASGHLSAAMVIILYLLPFVLALLLLMAGASIYWRLRYGSWRPSKRGFLFVYTISAILAFLFGVWFAVQIGMLDYAILIGWCGLVISTGLLIGYAFGRWLLDKFLPNRRLLRNGLLAVWVVFTLVVIVGLFLIIGDLPVPARAPVIPSAAGTVRATAEDMARFLIEIADPKYLSDGMAAAMVEPQVSLRQDLSWGMGPGIQHSPDGDALWQWGQAPDFQSVMIIYPETGYGVVVLTNSDWFNSDVAINIAERALGGEIDAIRRASHLEFNYQGPFLE